jgi:titin
MAINNWASAKRAGTGFASLAIVLGSVLLPAGAASAATVNYVPLLPTQAYSGDTVVFGESCPQEVGALCPTGGHGTVSVDGNQIGTFGPNLPYTVNWKASGVDAPHSVIIAFTDATSIQQNTTGSITVLPRQPSAPQNLAFAVDANNHASVSWSAPTQAGASPLTGYSVSVDAGQASTTTQANFDVTYVAPGGHTLTVAAENSDGTGPTASLTFFRPATSLPTAPTNLNPTNGPNATLSWSAPAKDGGSLVTQYAVQVDSGNFYYQASDQLSFNLSQIQGISYGTHTVAVSAVNSNGQGSVASAQLLYSTAPAAPALADITMLTPANKPVVSWLAPDNHGSTITEYDIYIDNNKNPDIVPGTTLTYVIANQLNGSHTFHLAARNVYGRSTYTSVQFQIISPTAPTAPQNLTVDTTKNHAVLSWTAPLTDGGALVSGYIVTVAGKNPVTVSGLSYDLSWLDAGDYTVSVAAKNSIGTGAAASIPVTRPIVTVPDVITDTGASSGPAPSLNWSAPANDGGQDVTGYVVIIDGGAPISVSGNLSTSYLLQTNGLAYGQHSATVAAVNPMGTGPASTPISVTFESLPTAPGNVQITSGVAQPVVSWTASTVQGGSIQKYNVYVDNVLVGSTVDGNALQYTLPVQAPGVHSVAVTATSLFSVSTQSVGLPFTAPDVPPVPTGLSATATLDQVIFVNWTQPVADGGAPITGYVITVDPGIGQVQFTVSGSASGANVPTPSTFVQGHHTVTVAAQNGVGVGVASDATGVDVFAPLRITIANTVAPAVAGSVTISGVVTIGTTTTAAAGETVNLVRVIAGAPAVPVATTVTGADGSYAFNTLVSTGSVYQVQAPGDAPKFFASGSSVTATVIPHLTATLKQATAKGVKVVKTKVKTKLLYTVGVPLAPAGTKVNIQVRLGSGSWKTVASATVSGKTAKAFWTPSKAGKYQVRAVIAGKAGVVKGYTTAAISLLVTK